MKVVIRIWHACCHGVLVMGYYVSVMQGYVPPVTDDVRYQYWLYEHRSDA